MHLVDAHLAADPAKYMAALLASLSAMLHLQLPHVNVLSKVVHRHHAVATGKHRLVGPPHALVLLRGPKSEYQYPASSAASRLAKYCGQTCLLMISHKRMPDQWIASLCSLTRTPDSQNHRSTNGITNFESG